MRGMEWRHLPEGRIGNSIVLKKMGNFKKRTSKMRASSEHKAFYTRNCKRSGVSFNPVVAQMALKNRAFDWRLKDARS